MIRTYLEMQVKEGRSEQLARLFQRRRILELSVAQPGCSSAELTISEDGTSAIVTATWDDEEAYARWTSRGDRATLSAEVSSHLAVPIDPATVGGRYEVAWRAPAELSNEEEA